MRENSFEKATEIARRILKETPRDNGTWARLVEAQLVGHDLPGANQALAEWRSAVRKNSPKRSELTGDVAMQEGNAAAALEAWSKATCWRILKNLRVLNKLAQRLSRAASMVGRRCGLDGDDRAGGKCGDPHPASTLPPTATPLVRGTRRRESRPATSARRMRRSGKTLSCSSGSRNFSHRSANWMRGSRSRPRTIN